MTSTDTASTTPKPTGLVVGYESSSDSQSDDGNIPPKDVSKQSAPLIKSLVAYDDSYNVTEELEENGVSEPTGKLIGGEQCEGTNR